MAKLSLYPPSHFEHQPPGKRAEELEKGSAERIITTLPSATEIVALLGLGEKLVGITHECDYPPEVRSKPVVMWSVFDSSQMTSRAIDDAVLERVTKGESVYKIDEQLLRSLQPDLIITQELCEVCATPLREVAKTIANLNPKPRKQCAEVFRGTNQRDPPYRRYSRDVGKRCGTCTARPCPGRSREPG